MSDECLHIWDTEVSEETDVDSDGGYHINLGCCGLGGVKYCPFCGILLTREVEEETLKIIAEEKAKRDKEYQEMMENQEKEYVEFVNLLEAGKIDFPTVEDPLAILHSLKKNKKGVSIFGSLKYYGFLMRYEHEHPEKFQ